MTIEQAITALRKEKQDATTSRYPCRAIMVTNVEQYCALLERLTSIPDIAKVPASELFDSADVMARYENLKAEKYQQRWVILTGVSEYLRLFSKSEMDTQRFAKLWRYQAPASNLGRIIIPLWGCEAQWHDKALHLCEDTRQDAFYYDCCDSESETQKLALDVLSGDFEQYSRKMTEPYQHAFIGLQKWYEYWAAPSADSGKQLLLTKRYGVNVVRDSRGMKSR